VETEPGIAVPGRILLNAIRRNSNGEGVEIQRRHVTCAGRVIEA